MGVHRSHDARPSILIPLPRLQGFQQEFFEGMEA